MGGSYGGYMTMAALTEYPELFAAGANLFGVVNSALKKRGVPVEYLLFPDEGHGWRKTANRITSAVAITKFFVKYLK
jgi:dipeptidyl aminopeptidase/acylaminoacyl peptidase